MKNDTIIKSENIKEKEIPTTNKAEELSRIVQIISGKKEIEQGKSMDDNITIALEQLRTITKVQGLSENKKYKLKGSIQSKLKKLYKGNEVIACVKRTNRNAEFIVTKIIDDKIYLDGTWRACSSKYIYMLNGKYPMIFLPEWSLLPEPNKDFETEFQDEDKRNVEAQKIIIGAVHADAAAMKNNMFSGIGIWLIIIGVIAVLGWIFFGGK